MRAIFLGGILALTTAGSQCQVLCPPQIEWQQSYGTTDYDNLAVAKPSAVGGYLLAGTRNEPPWGNQFYVSRIDLAGNLLWETNYGGSFSDTLTAAEETADGGLVLAGYSNSRAGNNKSAPNYGALDYWVVRLDAAGNKLWDRSYGGEAWDELYAVVETPDGGFLLGGYSSSLPGSGTKTSANYGFYDYWVVRVDMHGRELWQQSFGGSDSDYLLAMTGTTNGFLLTGGSASAVTPIKTAPNHGAYDFWAVRIDDNGHKLWDRSYGGDNSDFSRAVIAQSDGGFMLGGGSRSGVSGTKTARNFSGDDFWIVRINSEGSNIWDQSYGGLSEDTLGALAELPGGGFVLAGLSYSSPGGTKTSPNRGEIDYWVVRLGPSGQQLWDQSFGGLQGQNAKAVGGTPDGGFFVAGTSWSEPGGNKTSPNFGFSDFWFLKLRPETPGDCDGDGVPDERDLCPATPAGGLVDARGCTLEQSCPCEAPWRNSSEYVNCVRHVTADFVRAGLLTPEQREILLTQARLTNCPPPVPPPDTVIAFGFTNVALGGATLSSSSPDFEVSSSSSSYGWSVFASDLDFDGTRGMAVLLGEADSGMFFYPDAPVEWGNFDPSNFMLGKAFGRMNGTDNLLIGAMQARKTYYEVYPVEIDLSPLAPTSLTIQVFLKGVLQSELQVTGATTRIVVHASVTVGPRGNPFWRMPDGSVGAVVDLTAFELPTEWDSVAIGLPGVEDHVIGDRIFIRANNPAYEVDFVSRFEVYGGGGLPSFSMVDGQIGMFKLPHRISGYAVFGAAGGSLTIENVRPEMPDHGTIVELPETRLFDLSLAPVTLTSNEYFSASFNLAGEGIGSGGPYVYPHNVSASLEHRGPRVDLRFAGSLNATSVLVKVYKHGSLVGQTLAPLPVVGSFAAKGNGSGPPLAGFTAAAGNSNAPISLTLSLDRLQTFTAANGSEFRGNLIRLEPQSADKLFSINGAGIFTTHSSFTIRDEQIALVSPRLSIAETESDATITWPLQNHPFALEAASSLDGPFSAVTNEPVELEGTVSLPLPFEPTATRFFRLRLNEQ